MNLRGPIARVQRFGSRLYVKLGQRFRENSLIRDTWTAMAQDLDQQVGSLRALKLSFWKQLKKERKQLLIAIKEIASLLEENRSNHLSEWSLNTSFARTLDFEERIILKVYAPLIYRLRSEWNERAVDFYIMVNAHLARLVRLIQPFSGDPVLIHRCSRLLEQFEKDSQVPPPEPKQKKKKGTKRSTRLRRLLRPALHRIRKVRIPRRVTAPRSGRMVKRTKALVKRAKPLVKRIPVSRRRVRR